VATGETRRAAEGSPPEGKTAHPSRGGRSPGQ
jgi:hypothetical protein